MLKSAIYLVLTLFLSLSAQAETKPLEVHDPVLTKEGDTYYVFSTGPGITFYSSKDMKKWELAGRVFEHEPSWARRVAPGFNGHLWAPDIYQKNGKFYLYYSVSAFGKNTSGMGVAVNTTLNPESEDYRWVDQGIILQSVPNRDHWNAIDPAIVEDENGTPWMSFGSFWEGLKLVKMDDDLVRLAEPQEWYSIAKRPGDPQTADADPGEGAIEAPYIFKKNDYYYLFVSFDKCCRGMDSDYKIMVGRSKSVTGPYLDKDGKDMRQGGGTLVLEGNKDWVALGHNAAYSIDGKDYLVFHAYESADNGVQKLKIMPIEWQNDWPVVDPQDLNRYHAKVGSE
ncbi:arabinan endo-1,5-alpha-L-arabinosidase [Lacimicrobium alkaliphilum]|uniref:Extracellular exo-alpha-(1->5)-L-arabinofuranosidase n=1 Tax=Lacimicrobium alkaliphilum TaxID=1526571 RepID=A0ABQ1R1B6_9ALTE|nr:arabinan endo-1,5-alpha-L-arabinosidase [Lacimicrobium alkaliphilum]GGD51777.1 extracellular endo-alpha-(1->5)-L-arabinanase 1 [Lacimicrobium alkaliphilum]